jgi:hypothetical protein
MRLWWGSNPAHDGHIGVLIDGHPGDVVTQQANWCRV